MRLLRLRKKYLITSIPVLLLFFTVSFLAREYFANIYVGKHLYAGENLLDDMNKIIKDFKPTVIVYPHSNDRHPDHCAVNAFVKYSLAAMNYTPEHEWLYLVHRGDWPTPLERKRNMYLTPPMSLLKTETTWLSFRMSD